MSGRYSRFKKWLVLGAGGQLGSEWCFALERDKRDFLGLTRKQLDITDSGMMKKTIEKYSPDVVVNAAAYTKVDQAEEEKETAKAINSDAAGRLAAICSDAGIPLIHYSTDYVFPGKMEDRRLHPEGYPEDFPANPVNWYGWTKWAGEEKIRAAGGTYLIVRVSWLCGLHGNNFVNTMLRLAEKNSHLKVVGDQWGCPTYTKPVVHNTISLIEQKKFGTWHLSSEGETTWHEFACAIFKNRGISVDVESIATEDWPTLAVRPSWSRLDIRKLADVPGTRILPWHVELKSMLSGYSQ